MRTVTGIGELRALLREARTRGARVGFVPTMGFLHEGHLRLVDRARERSDVVVMSIFVNPLQFAPTDDLSRYPRDPKGDAAKAASRGVAVLFAPTASELYPGARTVSVEPRALADRWEGAERPGHFAGVLTVVAKLFNIVRPDVAVFGQKDYQQAALVRALVRDLDFAIDVDVAPIVREADGLAMSSRNSYLTPDERLRARALSRALRHVCAAFEAGDRSAERLVAAGMRALGTDAAADYLAIVDPDSLEPLADARADSIVLLAARVGRTRLLDNAVLGHGIAT